MWKCGQNFTLLDEHGETHSLHEFRGQVVMIDFSAIWCPPCRAQADVLENLNDDYKDRGVKVLTVLFDEESNGPDWYDRPVPAECLNWSDRSDPNPDHTFPCWVDGLTPAKTRVSWPLYNKWGAVPTNVILDTGLRVVYSTGGYPESTIRQKLNLLVGATDTCLP
ncbi:MAG: TlpA family protein disulfide reductase [Acidobacteria bacterium]|nr:TlpA family protein disulfide reductase [Acidobacteriota bacterium]